MAAAVEKSAIPPSPASAVEPVRSVRITALSGETLLRTDVGAEVTAADLISRLPELLLSSQEYHLLCGDRKLDSDTTLAELSSEGAGGEMALSAVVDAAPQMDLDLALIEAAGKCDLERTRRLMAAGASAAFVHDPDGVWGSQDRKSALHMALKGQRGDDRRAIIEALIAAGADVNAQRAHSDWRGCGSSQTAFEMVLAEAMKDATLLKLFLDAGADPNTQSVCTTHSMRTDGSSNTYVLHKAAELGGLEAARTLLEAGAAVDAVSKEEYHNERGFNRHMEETAFHVACRRGDKAMAALLLERGASVEFVRKNLEQENVEPKKTPVTDDPRHPDFELTVRCIKVEETALHLAIARKDAELVAMLVRAGADVGRPRVRGDARSTPEELCGGDAGLLEALRGVAPAALAPAVAAAEEAEAEA